MADEAQNPDAEDGEGGAQKKKLSGKKLVLFIVLPLLLLCGGGAAAFFLLSGGGEAEVQADAGEAGDAEGGQADAAGGNGGQEGKSKVASLGRGDIVFYDLPELLVNLNTGGKRSTFLKLTVALELQSQSVVPDVERVLPRITDSFQVYLRELRLEDLKGSAGLMRLKEELLVRLNLAAGTTQINDILFKEMLVQ